MEPFTLLDVLRVIWTLVCVAGMAFGAYVLLKELTKTKHSRWK
jgi:hypothetical protein